MTPSIAAAALVAAATLSPAFAAEDTGKVDASLALNGRALRLSHGVAWQNGNEENLDDAPHLMIFLSDRPVPIPLAVGPSTARVTLWARDAGATLVVVRADPAGKGNAASAGVLAAPGLEPGGFSSLSSSEGLKGLRLAGGRVAATASIGASGTTLNGSFDVPVAPVAISEDIKGPAAGDSAPATAFLAYMAALKKADFAAAGRYATASRMKQLEQARAQVGPKFAEMVKQMPSPTAKSVVRVVVRGGNASIVQASKEVNELVKEGSDWKVD